MTALIVTIIRIFIMAYYVSFLFYINYGRLLSYVYSYANVRRNLLILFNAEILSRIYI